MFGVINSHLALVYAAELYGSVLRQAELLVANCLSFYYVVERCRLSHHTIKADAMNTALVIGWRATNIGAVGYWLAHGLLSSRWL